MRKCRGWEAGPACLARLMPQPHHPEKDALTPRAARWPLPHFCCLSTRGTGKRAGPGPQTGQLKLGGESGGRGF